MTVPIVHEPDPGPPHIREHCCFCRKPTDWWTNIKGRRPGDQVACCEGCSPQYLIRDVPTKRHWCETEEKIRGLVDDAFRRGMQARRD